MDDAFGEGVDFYETGVDGAGEAAEFGDEAYVSLLDLFVGVLNVILVDDGIDLVSVLAYRTHNTARDRSQGSDQRTERVHHRTVPAVII